MLNPYASEGVWLKVNLHMHTNRSDGRWDPAAAVAAYRLDGYGSLAVTDHDLLFDPAKEPGASDTAEAGARPPAARETGGMPGVRIIPAQEVHMSQDKLDRCDYHIVGLGLTSAIPRQRTGQEAVDAIRSQGGLAVLCHPLWSDMRQEEMDAVRGCVAVEIWNGVCERLLGRGNSVFYWDSYLSRFDAKALAPGDPPRPLWGVAVDDAHRYPEDVGSGWIWVQLAGDEVPGRQASSGRRSSPDRGRSSASPAGPDREGVERQVAVEAVLAALRRGAFYSSQGPRIETVLLEDQRLVVYTSSAVAVRFVGSGGRMLSQVTGAHVKSAEYTVGGDERYVRVEVEDRGGRVAWSNPIWVAPLESAPAP